MNELDEYSNFTLNKINSFQLPKYEEDCDLIDICENLGATYNCCYKGHEILPSQRCSIETKQNILLQHSSRELAEKNAKKQNIADKRSTIRSWIQLILAAVLGGIVTKGLDLIFQYFIK